MTVLAIVSTVVALVAVGAASYAIGLYRGEVGRREDVQWAFGLLRADSSPSVDTPKSPEERAVEAIAEEEKAHIRSSLVEELEAQGRHVSTSELEAEVDRLYAAIAPGYGPVVPE